MIDQAIADLIGYALHTRLIEPADQVWAVNRLLPALGLDAWEEMPAAERPLGDILQGLSDWAAAHHLIEDDQTGRELFDTELMGRLTPRPSQVVRTFWDKYKVSPQTATDWFYRFSMDTNYIRRDRIARDAKWKAATPYGELDITINLSKPERTQEPLLRLRLHRKAAIPAVHFAARMKAMQAGSTTLPAKTIGSYPSPSTEKTGSFSTVPMSTTMSTVSFSMAVIPP